MNPTSSVDEEYAETEWCEMKSDGSCDDFCGMFDDPDPFETFTHSFRVQNDVDITITLLGHRAENGQTLNSTGLTLWRAAPILCDFLISNAADMVENKGDDTIICAILYVSHLQPFWNLELDWGFAAF
jgi:hypothetical protein